MTAPWGGRGLPPGWTTDLAVLAMTGSEIVDRGDHLVVRTPHNPGYQWGHVVVVTDPDAVDDADRWVDVFAREHPHADWVAVGLVRMPADVEAWRARGLDVELDAVLTTSSVPRSTPLPSGYAVRPLQGADWDLALASAIAENARTGAERSASFRAFAERRIVARRALCDRGSASFFGAFAGDALVAELGIVDCGDATARYQDVRTVEEHRRRGLASHLLGVAARWAAERGCRRWVIVTEEDNPAWRVYRSVGFEPDAGNPQAFRKPPRPA